MILSSKKKLKELLGKAPSRIFLALLSELIVQRHIMYLQTTTGAGT
jgi:hypothetical protein